jgi:CCR4-NOT transcription complex subunit 3
VVIALEFETNQCTRVFCRLKEINLALDRHKFHMAQLETMLRMLENDQLSVDDVETVKESVEYYVDSNQV